MGLDRIPGWSSRLIWAGPPTSRRQDGRGVLQGKVVTLGSALRSLGIDVKPDPESTAREMVLLGDDRSITPLFRDEASRALFLDERLRDSRAEIQGRRFRRRPLPPGLHIPGRTRRTAPDARILL